MLTVKEYLTEEKVILGEDTAAKSKENTSPMFTSAISGVQHLTEQPNKSVVQRKYPFIGHPF